jgi:hypothetical protein
LTPGITCIKLIAIGKKLYLRPRGKDGPCTQ